MAKRIREKAAKLAETRDKRPKAHAKDIRMSSSKVAKVLDLVRGQKYLTAVAILENTPNAAARPILKVMNSAAANAENNLNMDKDSLYVAECYANPGRTLKRLSIRARGRADRILKRTAHITVVLDAVAAE